MNTILVIIGTVCTIFGLSLFWSKKSIEDNPVILQMLSLIIGISLIIINYD